MLDDLKDRARTSQHAEKIEQSVQATRADHLEQDTEALVGLPDICPNCGSSDRVMEPFVDENGTLTGLLTVLCTGCGYRLGDIPTLPLGAEAEDAEKSREVLPEKDLPE